MMSPIITFFRVLTLTAIGLLASLFLSIPVYAGGELPVVRHGSDPAAVGKAVVRFRSFNAPGGKDVYFGVPELPNDAMSVHDWVNEAAWGERNPFVITYSAATGELSVSITVQTLRDVETVGPVRTYSSANLVGDLGTLNYLQWTIANRAVQQRVTSAKLGVENLVFNGTALGSYVIDEGAEPAVLDFAVEGIDFTTDFTISGEIVQAGKHSATPDDNQIEILVGAAGPVQDERTGDDGNATGSNDENSSRDPVDETGGSDTTGDNSNDNGSENGGGSADSGNSGDHSNNDHSSDNGNNGGNNGGNNDGGDHGSSDDGGSNNGGGRDGGGRDDSGGSDAGTGTPEGGNPNGGDPTGGEPEEGGKTPTAPVEQPTVPTVDPATEPVVTDPQIIKPVVEDKVIVAPIDAEPVTETPQQPGSFTLYLPATMQMATLAAR